MKTKFSFDVNGSSLLQYLTMKITDLWGNVFDEIPVKGVEIFYDKSSTEMVEKIIEDVRLRKDESLIDYARKYDNADDNFSIRVSEEEFSEARSIIETNSELYDIAKGFLLMAERVEKFHLSQLDNLNLKGKWTTTTGGIVGQVVKPVESVCVYVPGGRAIYPSTLIMNVIPAKVAGVRNIYISTPSKKNRVSPVILYLCEKLGIKDVFKIGGAVAVAAFAFGTQTVPKVEMVVGPGNKYFVIAKKLLNGIIGIDMLPGPSEIGIIADNGNPYYLAIDILSQLEHDPDSSAYVISPKDTLISGIKTNITNLISTANRKNILDSSIKNLFFILVDTIDEGFEVINKIAPEHLEVIIDGVNIDNIDKYIRNAGTVLIGETTPVVVTDYFAGTNHVLPTGTTARFSSPLGVYNFVKFYNIAYWTLEELIKDKDIVSKLARYEGLEFHALSIEERKG